MMTTLTPVSGLHHVWQEAEVTTIQENAGDTAQAILRLTTSKKAKDRRPRVITASEKTILK